MTRIEEIEKASKEYRESREKCGVKDPILLDEVDEAHFTGAMWADANPIHNEDVDLEKESMNYLLNEHKSPLTKVMHGVDLWTEMQYHKDIQDAFKAGYNKAMEEYVKGIPLQSWQTPCADPNYPCENPQMDCINCPRFGHPQGTITMTNMEE